MLIQDVTWKVDVVIVDVAKDAVRMVILNFLALQKRFLGMLLALA